MKISELTDKEFLCAPSALENSYILINYADEDNETPATYKASIKTLGETLLGGMNFVQTDAYRKTFNTLDVSEDIFVEASIPIPTPYTANVSEMVCNYVLMESSGDAYIVEGSEQTIRYLGYPVFYNESEGKIGYYSGDVFNAIT